MPGAGKAGLAESVDVTFRPRASAVLTTLAWVAVASLAGCPSDPVSGGTSPGIRLSATSLVTEESGPNGAIDVSLETQPASTVVVSLTSQDLGEGKVVPPGSTTPANPVVLQFEPADWNVPRSVQVDPQVDGVQDGNQTYTITAAVTSTTDAAYLAVPARTLSVTNVDGDVAGFTVSEMTASTGETGTTDTFTVRLNWLPTATVTIPVVASDESEGLVSVGAATPAATLTLTFSAANWSSPQTVTVVGQDDDVADGNPAYAVTVGPPSGAAEYAALVAKTVTVTNLDDDVPGITVAATPVPLVTSEGGATSTFSVRLNTQPVGTVTVPVTSGNADEGLLSAGLQNGLAAVSLIFTETSWSEPQVVTVTGQDDAASPIAGDNVEYGVTVGTASGDPAYASLPAQAVQVLNVDDEDPAVIVPVVGGAPLQTRESGAGKDATFTVMLNRVPSGPVVVRVTSNDVSEGKVMGGGSPTVAAEFVDLTFTPEDYLTPQTVTVVGQADVVADGEQAYTVTVGTPTGDAGYSAVASQQVPVANADTNVPGFTVSKTAVTHAEGGPVATFTVRLNAQPLADVTTPVSSGNPAEGLVAGGDSGGAFVQSLGLVFTPGNWSTAQTVQVQGQLDGIDDGPQTYEVTVGPTSSTSPLFSGIASKLVTATNDDVDTAGIAIDPAMSVATSEAGLTSSFTVRLTSKPTAAVTVSVGSYDTSEALVGGSPPGASTVLLQFDATNWDAPQPVTVFGVQDTLVDGLRPYTISVSSGGSADPLYKALPWQRLDGTNADDDVGVSEGTATPVSLAKDYPRAGQVGPADSSYYSVALTPGATFALRLSAPSAEVSVTADDEGDFTAGNLCTATVAADGSEYCSGLVPASGSVFVRVSTLSSAGAGFQLLARLYKTCSGTANLPFAIPDSGYYASFLALTVTGAPTAIEKVRLRVTITHPRVGDVGILLRPPAGSSFTVQVFARTGMTGADFLDTVFDDDAPTDMGAGSPPFTGTFRPDYPLSEVNGGTANGTWYIGVQDLFLVNTGTLVSWSIDVL